jgi:hypothetical protein
MKFADMTTDELIASFERFCLEQYKTDLDFDMGGYKRAFKSMMAVSDELHSRPGDRRRALVTLYDHPNEQVRLKAAIHTLALFPKEACAVLQRLIDDKIQPQAADASGILRALRERTYIPE